MQILSSLLISTPSFELVIWEVPPDLEGFPFVLTEREEDRAAKFATEELRQRWRAMRTLARQQLAEWLGKPEGELDWQECAGGKPFLAKEFLKFNLSHSENWLGLVRGLGPAAVGVDVELPRAEFPWQDVLQEHFTFQEQQCLLGQSAAAGERLFYEYWTAKEALMKATGLGLRLEPGEIELRLCPEGHPVGFAGSWSAWQLCGAWHREKLAWAVVVEPS